MSKGRLFKFIIDIIPINNNMDHFLFNIVKNRPKQQIYITGNKVAINSMDKNDYIFIQSGGYITHFMKCSANGPIEVLNDNQKQREIYVENITKLNNPVKSIFPGQGYNKLNDNEIKDIIRKGSY